MPPHAIWRRVRHPFSISAPRMRVRSDPGWPWKIGILGALALLVVGMWWWGYDFGQFFSGFNRSEMRDKLAGLETENARLRDEANGARAHFAELESDAAIMRGAQASLAHQNSDLVQENAQLKEELAFLQKLVSDSSKQGAMTVQSLTAQPEGAGTWHYAILLVRGGNPREEFAGHVTLQATVATPPDAGTPAHGGTINLPADQPDSAAPLTLKFKYYQRVEGTIHVPEGARLTALAAQVFENGNNTPRASRTLTIP